MLVKDVMTTDIITIMPEKALKDLLLLYKKFRHHTLPVVDQQGNLLGLVDLTDIMKFFMPHSPSLSRLLKAAHFYHGHEADILETELTTEFVNELTVEDIMTNNIVSIDEGETIAEARSLMISHDIKYMPVTDNHHLVGIITLSDIIMELFRDRGIIA